MEFKAIKTEPSLPSDALKEIDEAVTAIKKIVEKYGLKMEAYTNASMSAVTIKIKNPPQRK